MTNVYSSALSFSDSLQIKLTLFKHPVATKEFPEAKSLFIQVFEQSETINGKPYEIWSVPIDQNEDFIKQQYSIFKIVAGILERITAESNDELINGFYFSWILNESSIHKNLAKFTQQYRAFIKP